MNREIELALKTWYPKDHPLHYELPHPLGKLVGEWGELLDDYMKHLYKPGYQFNPKDELIDIWYYIRILAYQADIELLSPWPIVTQPLKIEYIIASAINNASREFLRLGAKDNELITIDFMLKDNYSILIHLCSCFDLTIDQLTEASWEKLKPGSERGEEWMKAREM